LDDQRPVLAEIGHIRSGKNILVPDSHAHPAILVNGNRPQTVFRWNGGKPICPGAKTAVFVFKAAVETCQQEYW
jgi:hypothetical protein